jgi:homoserine O-acetyltransferase/O-succinyltransferase
VTGWHEGDPVGRRQFLDVPTLGLESGQVLPDVRIAYETWGSLDPDGGNAVLICHALTGDSHVAGPAGPGHPTPGWWDALVGPGKVVDTRTWYVVTANVLGGCQGSTGPSSAGPDGRAWGSRFPRTTIRDQVSTEQVLSDALGVHRWAAVLGGSMGGMRVLEWAAMAPERVRGVLVLAAPAASSAEQIAWCATQRAAIRSDPSWRGGDYHDAPDGARPDAGLGIARRIAHVTYRSETELASRFGRTPQGREDPARGGRYAVESYLDHQATKLIGRFDAGSYVALTEAMEGHDLGRLRSGPREALAGARASGIVPVVVAIDSDRLYPSAQQAEVAALLDTDLSIVHSEHGHDGFLLEAEQVGGHIARLLAAVRPPAQPGPVGTAPHGPGCRRMATSC